MWQQLSERNNPAVASARLAMDASPLIRTRLAELGERGGHEPFKTGRLAALWRAQARAARLELTIDKLRRYCLDMLRSRRVLDDNTRTTSGATARVSARAARPARTRVATACSR